MSPSTALVARLQVENIPPLSQQYPGGCCPPAPGGPAGGCTDALCVSASGLLLVGALTDPLTPGLLCPRHANAVFVFRSESVEGCFSPSRCGSRNGERDWENASTASSVASGAEYTGEGCTRPGGVQTWPRSERGCRACCGDGSPLVRLGEPGQNRVLAGVSPAQASGTCRLPPRSPSVWER